MKLPRFRLHHQHGQIEVLLFADDWLLGTNPKDVLAGLEVPQDIYGQRCSPTTLDIIACCCREHLLRLARAGQILLDESTRRWFWSGRP